MTGASTTTYTWEASEAGDAACTYQHQGIVRLNSTAGNFIDLNSLTGANSSGYAIPGVIGGASAGSLASGTLGWSFEATVRVDGNFANAKIFSLGSGGVVSSISLGNDGTNNAGLTFGLYDTNTNTAMTGSEGHSAFQELVNPAVLEQWYHVVAVLQQVVPTGSQPVEANTSHGAWWLYVNGQLMGYPTGIVPNQFQSSCSCAALLLSRKDHTTPLDPNWSGLIDTFRIYNYALTGGQVGQLYAGEMGGCTVPTSTAAPDPATVTPNLLPRTTTGPVAPIFSATFDTNPLLTTTGASGYGWSQVVTADSPTNQFLHRGLLQLTGGSSQFVNLALASGANSIGQTLPTIGGGTAGWTIEVEFYSTAGADAWSKVYDLGSTRNPNPLNDIVLGWDGSAGAPDFFWQFDVADNTTAGNQYQTGDALGEVAYNTWYHAVAVITPTANGLANYLLYVNGQLYTTVTNAFYPVAAVRQNAYIGRSGWSDPYWSGYVDFFNVYSQALSDAQVAALYAATQVLPASAFLTVCTAAPSCPSTATAVPPAWYNLTFPVNPTTLTGASAPTYTWEATDAGMPSALSSIVEWCLSPRRRLLSWT